jgi:hypothetical protein
VISPACFAFKKQPFQSVNKKLPVFNGTIPVEQPREMRQAHWVQCDHSMCLAVLDKAGKWKSFSNDRELTDFVKVCAG